MYNTIFYSTCFVIYFYFEQGQVPDAQKDALISFYDAMDGPNPWKAMDGILTQIHACGLVLVVIWPKMLLHLFHRNITELYISTGINQFGIH